MAGSLGLAIRFASSAVELGALTSSHLKLLILDLSSSEYDPLAIVRALKQNVPPLKILGFYPHVRRDLEEGARRAGVDFVVPNSTFLTVTRKILEGEAAEN